MNIRNKIKSLLAQEGMTITKLAEKLSKKTNEKYTFQSISHKLRRETLTLKEAFLIAEILDYNIEFIKK